MSKDRFLHPQFLSLFGLLGTSHFNNIKLIEGRESNLSAENTDILSAQHLWFIQLAKSKGVHLLKDCTQVRLQWMAFQRQQPGHQHPGKAHQQLSPYSWSLQRLDLGSILIPSMSIADGLFWVLWAIHYCPPPPQNPTVASGDAIFLSQNGLERHTEAFWRGGGGNGEAQWVSSSSWE